MSPRSLPKGAAGGVRCTRIQDARVAGGASDGLHGASATQAKTDRIDMYSSASRIKPWRGLSLHSQVWSTEESPSSARRMRAAQDPSLSCICSRPSRIPESRHAVITPWILVRLRVCGCSSSPSPSSGVMPRAWRGAGGRLILHGWLRPREHILPRKMAFRVGLVELC